MMEPKDWRQRSFAAQALAREVGVIAKRRFQDRSSFSVKFKGRQDFLTEVDVEVERLIASRLHEAFPGDGMIGEEGAGRAAQEGLPTWVVDPIDGTANFARGAPHWCVSIACILGKDIEIGAIYHPMLDEMYFARKGEGAFVNGQPMSPSSAKELGESAIEIGWNARAYPDRYIALVKRVIDTGATVARGGSGRAGPRLGRRRTARRLLRALHQFVGLPGGAVDDRRSRRLLQQLPCGRRPDQRRLGDRSGARHQGRADPGGGDRGHRALSESVRLNVGAASAEIALLGAEARAWRVGPHELLWMGEHKVWNKISPILFPVIGAIRDGARIGGRQYPLPFHGFATGLTFQVEAARDEFVRLSVGDSEATRALYPFAFGLALEYALTEASLTMAIEVKNAGAQPMPYACGLHPGFRWPFAGASREGAFVRFEQEELPDVPVIAPGGFFSGNVRRVPLAGKILPIDDALFANDAACFLQARSRSLSFVAANGASITMDFPSFAHVALWTRPGAPFLCLEPWTGYGDPVGFAGELKIKPSMLSLEPGAKARHEAIFRFQAA